MLEVENIFSSAITGAIIGATVALVIALLQRKERSRYYELEKEKKIRNRATGDLDKMLSDFRALAEVVISVKDRSIWLNVNDGQGTRIKQRQKKFTDLRAGQAAFDDLSKEMSKNFDESREWDFKVMENQLNHYFVSLHDLIEQIEKSRNLDQEDKVFYMDRVRRSLSTHEILTLFYFCMGETPLCKQLKHWVEKYHLFEVWPFYLFDAETAQESHLKFYDPNAFGKNRKFLP